MQKKKGIVALVAALCVLFSVVLCGVMVHAAPGGTLYVNLAVSSDEEYNVDLEKASVVIDVYKFAPVNYNEDTHEFSYGPLESAFASLQGDFDVAVTGRGDWQEIAQGAQALATEATPIVTGHYITGDEGSPLAVADNAVYLILARDPSEPVGSTSTFTETYEYEIQAALVAMPSTEPDETGEIHTDTGDWTTEVFTSLKTARKPLYGSLVINKTVNNFSGEKATFIFRIQDVAEGGTYDEYAAITYPDQTTTTVTHIPAGITVRVTEEYTGGRYRYVSGGEENVYIRPDSQLTEAEPVATVDFVNEPSGDHPGGHGIENHYERGDGSWPWTQRPAAAEQ